MTIVVATLAVVRAPWLVPPFVRLSARCVRQALEAPGNAGAEVRARSPLTWCTLTGWESEDDLRAYVRSGDHAVAMAQTARFLRSSRFARLGSCGRVDSALWPSAFRSLNID